MYFHGNGVSRDLQQAYFWMKVAALQGDEDSTKSLEAITSGCRRTSAMEPKDTRRTG